MKYLCTFDRIGRTHHIPPQEFEAADVDELAALVYKFARPRLASRDVEVAVNLDEGKGYIFAGVRNGGDLAVELVTR